MKDTESQPEQWKVGKYPSTVVSNKKVQNNNFPSPPNPKESRDEEVEFYGGYLICESIEDKNNAQLIAAAPEMLEALQDLILLVNDSEGVCGYHLNKNITEWNEFEEIENAQNAINKALGQ